ncbi:MAG: ABC transporter ATP-binding protein [Ilumatobacter sp.]|uniref:ABC transporter ATP-binding protein n=1 Tax=Ilumatobacter sp. TaxID=1967498 RepID=UPI0026319E29|nr:ABC transporter ATP-binding protein [Ilumatobacter sp.]MDJ0771299.1 ABC transporter ATP-binding protein [Ilumatobacter sp.]
MPGDGATPVALDPAVFDDVAREPGSPKPDAVLAAGGVERRFGGLTAVEVDRLEIQRGAITALIGPNGAGKTTLFNVLTGFDAADAGEWQLNGERIDRMPAYRVAQRGMVRTFQLTKSLTKLSVIDNMKLGATGQSGERLLQGLWRPSWIRQEREIEARAEALLERFGLAHMRNEFAGTMSGGQRKLLEMARALMSEPELLMLDEPMAGVNPALTQSLLAHITALRDEGMTVVFVEHDMDVVMEISDWVVVLAEGQVIAEGPPSHVVSSPEVIDAYLGQPLDGVDP